MEGGRVEGGGGGEGHLEGGQEVSGRPGAGLGCFPTDRGKQLHLVWCWVKHTPSVVLRVTVTPVYGEVGEARQVDGGEGGDGAVGAVEDVQALQARAPAGDPGHRRF